MPAHRTLRASTIALALLAACGTKAPPAEPLVVRAATPQRNVPVVTAINWTVTRSDLGFELVIFREVPVDGRRWPVGGVAMQDVEIGVQPDAKSRLRWLVRTGDGESLDGFRRDHENWTFSDGPAMTVCGQRVVPVIATHGAEDIVCVMTEHGNHPAWIAPRRAVAIQLSHRGLPVVASFEVESGEVDAWESAVAQFFAAMRCL